MGGIRHVDKHHYLKVGECVSSKTYSDIVGKLANIVDWKLDIPFNLPEKEYLDMACGRTSYGLKKIMPIIAQVNPVTIYHDCVANNYTSMRRDCIALPVPHQDILERFNKYTARIFEQEIKPLIENFEYSVNAYYNHLDTKQQKRWDAVDKDKLYKRVYGNFCKLEKQEVTSELKNPKNRNIASPNEEYKYVMGPVVYRLEQIFKKNFKGYSSGRNWSEREIIMNLRHKAGFNKLVQGDGSGFDRTQYLELKKACEFRIYQYLAEAGCVYHVDEAVFRAQALAGTITYNVRQMNKNGKFIDVMLLGRVTKTGTVQSGNCDTTFGNTLRMALYNRFIAEELLELDRDSYDLDCAGDDFALFLPTFVDNDDIRKAYYTVFRPLIKGEDDTIKHGLGQVLKYLKIGDIETCDFCSTETFYSPTTGSYKIIRKIDRFLTLTPWSRKALQMSARDQKLYMSSLAQSNELWIGNLPLLRSYNRLLENYSQYHTHKFNHSVKKKVGRKKKTLPLEKQHYQTLYDEASQQRFENLRNIFGSDEAYSQLERISDKTNCEKDFLDYLQRKYNITPQEVIYMEGKILNAIDEPIDHLIDLPIYTAMCDFKAIAESEITYDHLHNNKPIWQVDNDVN